MLKLMGNIFTAQINCSALLNTILFDDEMIFI